MNEKQYRITSSDFVLPGETGEPDCLLSEEDQEFVKSLTSPLAKAIVDKITTNKPDK
jgi:hypothetical protein